MKKLISAPFVLALAAVLLVVGCEKMQAEGPVASGDMKGTETPEDAGTAPTTQATVGTVTVGGTPFSVEYAVTDEEKARGLMDRESLPENYGMWFVFSQLVQEEFWMKDTLIPLDMIFVDEDMKVIYIKENAVPKSLEMIGAPSPYMYVLEVNAGKVAEHGIKVGDTVEAGMGPKND